MSNIKEKRIKLEMTQIELALKVGVSTNTIRSWETGLSNPSDENLEKLEKALKEVK